MTRNMKLFGILAIALILVLTIAGVTLTLNTAYAETTTDSTQTTETTEQPAQDATGSKALAAAIAIGLAGLGGAVAMGMAISKASEAIARQPEVKGDVRGTLMLGLVFIETVVIYALIVAILVVFVL